jgi:hypothetical protein
MKIMKIMKKSSRITALLLAVMLCLPLLIACGDTEDNTAPPAADSNEVANAPNGEAGNDDEAGEASPDSPEPVVEVNDPPEPEPEPEPEEDVPDSGTAKLLGTDFETTGNWVGAFGSEGYWIYTHPGDDSAKNLPDYATATFAEEQTYTWWDSEDGEPAHEDDEELAALREASAMVRPDGNSRIAACWYETYNFTLTINVGDTPRKVTLYMNDYDGYSRAAEVTVRNANGRSMQENPAQKVIFDVDDYLHGCYISYEISGEVMFDFECFNGNVVLSGIFFDPID